MTLHSVTGHRDGPLPLTMGKRGPLFPLRVFRHGKEAVHDTLRDVLCGSPAFGREPKLDR